MRHDTVHHEQLILPYKRHPVLLLDSAAALDTLVQLLSKLTWLELGGPMKQPLVLRSFSYNLHEHTAVEREI